MISPGDVVECHTLESICACGAVSKSHPEFPLPVLRRVYRVAETGAGVCRRCGTPDLCLQSTCQPHPTWAWPAAFFRRIEPASEDIFSLATTRILEPTS